MAGWSHQKRVAFERAFYAFLDNCWINSKNEGFICLGQHLYYGQRLFISTVLDGLERDIHKFYVLKSRQLGLTTISRALCAFYLGLHKGLKGCLVFDTGENRNEARKELTTLIRDLPARLKFPGIAKGGDNREGLTLTNDARILFKSAGVRKSKSSGGLGRSVGLSLAHLSELCSYDDPAGLEAFENSLSEEHPDRLYIYESTARGFNLWFKLWEQAKLDDSHCVTLFLGWWSHPKQRIPKDAPDFARYGVYPPTPKEQEKIEAVKNQYGFEIDQEQLAWVRRKLDPAAQAQGDADPEFEGNSEKIQEQPWTEEEAFQQTGAVFFASEKLTDQAHNYASDKFKAYMYISGHEFQFMSVIRAENTKVMDLKVWEEPDTTNGVYVLGADPAFGENEKNDRSAIQVLRCYSDGVDQVAEYASPLIATHQFAWVIASLLGWYGGGRAEIRYILELNGPGMAVWQELRQLRQRIDAGYQSTEIKDKGLQDIFRNVRTYIYSRPDSLGVGQNVHFKTHLQQKILLMERLRDFVTSGMLRLKSFDTIKEMATIAREGDTISAPSGMHDDRVFATALAVHCWETKTRPGLINARRSRDAEAARSRLSITDQVSLFQNNMLEQFFASKRAARVQDWRHLQRAQWRYGRR
jgi:hypothetical protein